MFVGNVLEMVRIPLKESKDQFLNNNRYRELIRAFKNSRKARDT